MVFDADIGASTDSLYEYLFKSYMLFNDRHYLDLFEEVCARRVGEAGNSNPLILLVALVRPILSWHRE